MGPASARTRIGDGKYLMREWWAATEERERTGMASYRSFVRFGELVFDIGANRGEKISIFRLLGAKVLAVEPLAAFGDEWVPELFWRFGDDKDVIIVPVAIGATNGKAPIWIQKNLPEMSSMNRTWMEESAHARFYGEDVLVQDEVRTMTLDGLISVYGWPQFIKVDVEGSENEVVKTLKMPVAGLNMEYHQDWIPGAAMQHMDSLGHYEWNYTLNNAGQFTAPEWMPRDPLIRYMDKHLDKAGPGSWGDIYGRLVD